MKIMKILEVANVSTKQVVDQTIEILNAGGLVIFPTETTYGAGVDATNPRAVKKLLRYKSRREGKPLSIAVTSKQMAKKYVELNDQAQKLYEQFLPGPITVVSKGKNKVAPGVESEFGTLGIRIPNHPLILKLLRKFKKPITATSANVSGKKRPYTINDILKNISTKQKKLIDLVLDVGELPVNPPSTVIDTTLSSPTVFRHGSTHASTKSSKNQTTNYQSKNVKETMSIAGKLCLKHWDKIKTTGLLIGLNGSLGAGKTIFAKGVAQFLQIRETITSPTYSFIEEYGYNRHGFKGKFFHLDVWKVGSEEEFQKLKVKDMLQRKNVIVIEWWDQVAGWTDNVLPDLVINLEEKSSGQRNLKVITRL